MPVAAIAWCTFWSPAVGYPASHAPSSPKAPSAPSIRAIARNSARRRPLTNTNGTPAACNASNARIDSNENAPVPSRRIPPA